MLVGITTKNYDWKINFKINVEIYYCDLINKNYPIFEPQSIVLILAQLEWYVIYLWTSLDGTLLKKIEFPGCRGMRSGNLFLFFRIGFVLAAGWLRAQRRCFVPCLLHFTHSHFNRRPTIILSASFCTIRLWGSRKLRLPSIYIYKDKLCKSGHL